MLKFDESQWTVTPSNDGGVPYYTLVGLRSGQRTRLFEIEYKLASALDGTKSLSAVLSDIRARYQIILSPAEARIFVNRLVQREVLSGSDPGDLDAQGSYSTPRRGEGVRRSWKPLLPFAFGVILAAFGVLLYEFVTTHRVVVVEVNEVSIPRFSPVRAGSDIPLRSGRLSFARNGVLETLSVERGDRVSNGQILAQLRLPSTVSKALSGLEQLRSDYNDMVLRLGGELGELRRFIERLEERVDTVEMQALEQPEKGDQNIRLKQLADEQALLLEKNQALTGLESSFEKVLEKLSRLKDERNALLGAHRDKFIRAPFDAVVEEVTCVENARIKAEQPCFVVVDQRNRIVEYRLREKPELYVGARVQLLKGDRWISGTLEEITQVYQQYLVRVRYSDEASSASNTGESARLLESWIEDAAAIPRSALWDSPRAEGIGYVLVATSENEAEVSMVNVVKRDARWAWIRIGDLKQSEEELKVVHDVSLFSSSAPPIGKTYQVSVTRQLDASFTQREWNPTTD